MLARLLAGFVLLTLAVGCAKSVRMPEAVPAPAMAALSSLEQR